MDKIRWGILSTAKIGREKVIPGLQASKYCTVNAIASRNIETAKTVAANLNIEKAYGSYEALLNDTEIDAIYIPLPNHLHVPWAIKALQANKHVLCEKPIALTLQEAKDLFIASQQKPHLKIMEAFMYRFHPQWMQIKKLISDGAIGQLKHLQSSFFYFNIDANNVRNKKDIGGGGLMDIGCYCISFSRFIFKSEPHSVFGIIEYDTVFETDSKASAILNFDNGSATFTCATQMAPYQKAIIFGTEGRIEIETPFTPANNLQTRVWLHNKNGVAEFVFNATDQYTLQANGFVQAILNNTDVPTSLQDAVNNMAVIDAIFKSGKSKSWQQVH